MKVQFDIDSYKTKFKGGARQYLFFALFSFPNDPKTVDGKYTNMLPQSFMSSALSPLGYNSSTNVIPYLVRTTSIPGVSFEDIQIPYPGLTYKMAGTRTYEDWTVSFNLDEDGELLKNFHSWQDKIYKGSANTYKIDQHLFLLDGNGNAVKEIKLVEAWPKTLSGIGLDYSSNEIATMDVTFSYQYYKMKSTLPSQTQKIIQTLLNKVTGSSLGGMF